MNEIAIDVHGRYIKLRRLTPAARWDNLGVAAERVFLFDHQMFDLVVEAMRLFVEDRGCGSVIDRNPIQTLREVLDHWEETGVGS